MTPEKKARVNIDALLTQAGWTVCDMAHANFHAARGVALREFPLNPGYGFADYLLYIDGKAAGVIEAKKERSGRANLNNFLSGNSGHKVLTMLVRQTGVSDGKEISATHTSHPHTGVQGPRGPCRIA